MITPIKSINIWDLMKRENDLLVSVEDIKQLARNERVQERESVLNEVIELYYEFQPNLATNVYEFGEALKKLKEKKND